MTGRGQPQLDIPGPPYKGKQKRSYSWPLLHVTPWSCPAARGCSELLGLQCSFFQAVFNFYLIQKWKLGGSSSWNYISSVTPDKPWRIFSLGNSVLLRLQPSVSTLMACESPEVRVKVFFRPCSLSISCTTWSHIDICEIRVSEYVHSETVSTPQYCDNEIEDSLRDCHFLMNILMNWRQWIDR